MGNCASGLNPSFCKKEANNIFRLGEEQHKRKSDEPAQHKLEKIRSIRKALGQLEQKERKLDEERRRERALHQHEEEQRRQAEDHRRSEVEDGLDERHKPTLLVCFGPPGSGKSQFIDSLTQETHWASNTLLMESSQTPPVRSAYAKIDDGQGGHIQVVVLDTPSFDDVNILATKVLAEVATWLRRNSYEHDDVAGILYFHRITDRRVRVQPELTPFLKTVCGYDDPRRLFFVTTYWDYLDVDQNKGSVKEQELRNGLWKSLLDSGAQMTRFDKSTGAAGEIVRLALATWEQRRLNEQRRLEGEEKRLK